MCGEVQNPTQPRTTGKDEKSYKIRQFPFNFKLQMFPTDVILSKVMNLFISAETFSITWNGTSMSICVCVWVSMGARSRFHFINALNLTRRKKKM